MLTPLHLTSPSSKSLSHRALIAAGLAHGVSTLSGILESDDILITMDILKKCGVGIERLSQGVYTITGLDGVIAPQKEVDCFVGESGTTSRLLTAILAAGKGRFSFHGAGRMHNRPMKDLIDILEHCGAHFHYDEKQYFLPFTLQGNGLSQPVAKTPHTATPVPATESSQYLSALLLAAPMSQTGMRLLVDSTSAVSKSYILLTLQTLAQHDIPFSLEVFCPTQKIWVPLNPHDTWEDTSGSTLSHGALSRSDSSASNSFSCAISCGIFHHTTEVNGTHNNGSRFGSVEGNNSENNSSEGNGIRGTSPTPLPTTANTECQKSSKGISFDESPVTIHTDTSSTLLALLHALRKAPHWPDMLCITIPKSPYTPRNIHIEGDFSGASYLLAAGALGKRPVSVSGLRHDSLQGDAAILPILERMGARVEWNTHNGTPVVTVFPSSLRGIDIDMGDCPDLVPTVAVLAARAKTGPTIIRNVSHLTLKESNRRLAPAQELAKIGCCSTITGDSLLLYPLATLRHQTPVLSSHDDHRMAMSLALLELGDDITITLDNTECVSKSYPTFWDDWKKLRPQSSLGKRHE